MALPPLVEVLALPTDIVNATCYNTEDLTALWRAALTKVHTGMVKGTSTLGRSHHVDSSSVWPGGVSLVVPERLTFMYYRPGPEKLRRGRYVSTGVNRAWWNRLDREDTVRIAPPSLVFNKVADLEKLASVHHRPTELPPEVVAALAYRMLRIIDRSVQWWRSEGIEDVKKLSTKVAEGRQIRIDAKRHESSARGKAARNRHIATRANTLVRHYQRRIEHLQGLMAEHQERADHNIKLALKNDPTIPVQEVK
jgi:hypothetical protein